MKRLFFCIFSLVAGCTLIAPPADTPATISRGTGAHRQVMFTFDARENAAVAAEILDVLHRYRVPAAFFVTGQFVEQHPDLTRRMAAEGHEVYNHSYSNPLLRNAPEAKIVEQLRCADAAIVRATGHSSKPFFRPAFGEADENLRRVAFREGYRVVRWTVASDDWKDSLAISTSSNMLVATTARNRDTSFSWTDKQKQDQLPEKDAVPPNPALVYATNIVQRFQPGSIVLFHVGYTNTLQMLEPLIKVTRGQDYVIVPMRDGIKP
ncbi:MAG: polysaccharide deacetylase family protein [Verrucomicrobia bacterium]|nr:MAG: polysaccharide deacetylase family protein [Verrucomicrobiota bacterium]